jgi:membrane protease subunit HflK
MILFKSIYKNILSLGDPKWGKSSDNEENSSSNENQGNNDKKGSNGDGRDKPTRPRPTSENNPPDLEEVWKDFNKKIGSLFGDSKGSRSGGNWGGGNKNGGSGGGMPPINFDGRFIGGGFVVIFLLWLASGFYIVEEGQTALVLRFGEYKYSSNAGFNWRIPYPVDQHETVNFAQLRQTTVGVRNNQTQTSGRDSLMLTTDENIVDVQFAVQYRVGNPEDYVFNNLRPDDIVRQAAETAMREVVGRSIADAVLYENKEAISTEALKITQVIADKYKSGLTIVNLTIQNVQPPEEVQAAFSDAIKAAQDAEKTKNEAKAYANDVIPRARGAARRVLEEAKGYQERVIATATGDSERFKKLVVEYKNAPQITRKRLYLESMEEVFSNVSKVMIETKSGSNLLYLPLDKLIQQRNTLDTNNQNSNNANNVQNNINGATNQIRNAIGGDGRNLRQRLREGR